MRAVDVLENSLEILRRKYIVFTEWRSILKKKSLYKDVVWSKQQQEEFDRYWVENYGKKISNRWHKLYESTNGVHRIDYFPEILFTSKLEPILNNNRYCKILRDKCFLSSMYGRTECVKIPWTYVLFSGNYCYDGNYQIISRDEALKKVWDIGAAVIKPTVDHGSGKNIIVVDFCSGIDQKTGEPIGKILERYGSNFVIQEKIIPHQDFACVYPHSINTIKILTYIVKGKVYHGPISMRFGSGGSWLDNIHAGGFCVGIHENGMMFKTAYRLGYGDSKEKIYQHPDTGFVFEGKSIPFIDRIIKTAYMLHGMTPHVGSVAWDMTIDDKNNIALIEANYCANSIWFPQIVCEEPMFGDNTQSILEMLRTTKIN